MAVKADGNTKLEISTDGGTTWQAVPQPENLSFKGPLGTIDIRHLDSTAVERIADLADASIDYTGYFVPGNATLAALRSANRQGTLIKVRLTGGDATNTETFTADALVTDYNLNAAAGGLQELSCTFSVSGAVT
ncbi:phage tail tube protein [Oceanithermus desulfurans]